MRHALDGLEHLVVPRLTGTSSYRAPNLRHLDFWSTSLEPGLTCQDAHNARAYVHVAVRRESTVPALRTVRFIFTLITRTLHGAYMVAHPDWPRICHPDLLRDLYRWDDMIWHRFPTARVAQTVAAIIPDHPPDVRSWQDSKADAESSLRWNTVDEWFEDDANDCMSPLRCYSEWDWKTETDYETESDSKGPR